MLDIFGASGPGGPLPCVRPRPARARGAPAPDAADGPNGPLRRQYVHKLCVNWSTHAGSLGEVLRSVNGYGHLRLPGADAAGLEAALWTVLEALGSGTLLTWYEHEDDAAGLIRHYGREHYTEWRRALPGGSREYPVVNLGGLRFMVRRAADVHVARAMVGSLSALSLLALDVRHEGMPDLRAAADPPAELDAVDLAVAAFVRGDPVVRACYRAVVGFEYGLPPAEAAPLAEAAAPLSLRGVVQLAETLRQALPAGYLWRLEALRGRWPVAPDWVEECLNRHRAHSVLTVMQLDHLLEPDEREAVQARCAALLEVHVARAAEWDVRLAETVHEWQALLDRLGLTAMQSYLCKTHNCLRARVEPAEPPSPRRAGAARRRIMLD